MIPRCTQNKHQSVGAPTACDTLPSSEHQYSIWIQPGPETHVQLANKHRKASRSLSYDAAAASRSTGLLKSSKLPAARLHLNGSAGGIFSFRIRCPAASCRSRPVAASKLCSFFSVPLSCAFSDASCPGARVCFGVSRAVAIKKFLGASFVCSFNFGGGELVECRFERRRLNFRCYTVG